MADASRPLRLYWDSCVFIEFLDPKVKEREKALRALVKFMDREAPPFTIVMSHLVLAEVRTRYGADEATTEIGSPDQKARARAIAKRLAAKRCGGPRWQPCRDERPRH